MTDVTPNSPEVQVKMCRKCGECKPVSEFSKDRSKRNGFQSRCKACARKYQLDNADRKREYNREYRKTHREERRASDQRRRPRIIEYNRKYRMAHPEVDRAKNHRRRARKLAAGGTHTAADIRMQATMQTNKRGVLRCWWCSCAMTEYHVDHRIALVRGGSNDARNLCLACPTCNMQKHDKLPAEFNGRLM